LYTPALPYYDNYNSPTRQFAERNTPIHTRVWTSTHSGNIDLNYSTSSTFPYMA
jgi:hypothetical protein